MSEKILYERVWAEKSRIKSVIALTHPTAVIIFSIATFILALFTSPVKSDLKLVILLTLAMAAAQASNGIFNEIFDRDLDEINKPWRAIPAGYIHTLSAAVWATALLCLGLLFALAVSPVVMFLLLGGIGTGILYSLKLKRTWWSWLPYGITYPSLPVWMLVAFGMFAPQVLWIYLIAAPFTIGIHLTNQLRDYEEDSAAGTKGFAQHLGKTGAVWFTFLLLVLGPIPSLVALGFSGQLSFLFLVAASILHWVLILPIHWFPVEAVLPATFRLLFRRLQLSCPVFLLAWYWVFLHG